MSLEHSHGKARPTLPRSSDLRLVEREGAEGERPAWRGADGRVGPGNTLGTDRGLRMDIARMLGRAATTVEAASVHREALRVYRSALRGLSVSSELVRRSAARVARHCALESFYASKAIDAGLDTEQGQRLDQRASYHGERAERCTVTLLDVAGALARPGRKGSRLDALRARTRGKQP